MQTSGHMAKRYLTYIEAIQRDYRSSPISDGNGLYLMKQYRGTGGHNPARRGALKS